MNSNVVPVDFWDSAAHPGELVGLDKQAVQDGQYLGSYFATDPKLNSTYNYPVTCGDLNALVQTGGRLDPSTNTIRRKGAKIGSQSAQLLVDQDIRTLNASNHPYANQMMYCSDRVPGTSLETRRIDTAPAIFSNAYTLAHPYTLA